MENLQLGIAAPDFFLTGVNDEIIHLADFKQKKMVLLCVLRGFA